MEKLTFSEKKLLLKMKKDTDGNRGQIKPLQFSNNCFCFQEKTPSQKTSDPKTKRQLSDHFVTHIILLQNQYDISTKNTKRNVEKASQDYSQTDKIYTDFSVKKSRALSKCMRINLK